MSCLSRRLITVPAATECRILERLNKFVVRIKIGGSEELAFLQNTGRLREYVKRDKIGFCAPIEKPKKLRYRLFAVKDHGGGALIDTLLQARAFERAVERNFIPWLSGYEILRREARIGGTRIDYLLRRKHEEAVLEVKSAVSRLDGYASYPDCPSVRARKQLKAILEWVKMGGKAFLVFVASIPNVRGFRPNHEVDPGLCDLIRECWRAGVEVRGVAMIYDPKSSTILLLDPSIPIKL